jgi:hypothetical protein
MGEATSGRRVATFLTGALMPHEFDEIQGIQRGDVTSKPAIDRLLAMEYLDLTGPNGTAAVTESGRAAASLHMKYRRGATG